MSVPRPSTAGDLEIAPAGTGGDPSTGAEHQEQGVETEVERAGRAKALAEDVSDTAAEVERDRARRARQTARDVTETASGVELDRARMAATLAIEAFEERRSAAVVAVEVSRLTTEVGKLRGVAERVESEVSQVRGGMTAVLTATEALHRGYGVDESALHDRARFPALLLWYGQMLEEANHTGLTWLAVLDEVLNKYIDRRRTSKARHAAIIFLLPILGALLVAITAWLLSRYFPAPPR